MDQRRHRRQLQWCLGVLLAVGAITTAGWSAQADAQTTLTQEVDSAADRFDAAGIDSYEITVRRWCFGCLGNFKRYELTVEHGIVTRMVAHGHDRAGEPTTEEWDDIPSGYEYGWIKRWGPVARALATLRDAVGGAAQDGPAAMYVPAGDHERVTKLVFEPKTGVPRKYSTYITNAFDTDYSVRWSNFRRLD